ncbi:hypothetical protein B0H14DRAFT_3534791 [Mycena olivaceomarginata]|nr:hypothetical protein B0H14DRAFT_3534791 [Mycena olivaceomarginata]
MPAPNDPVLSRPSKDELPEILLGKKLITDITDPKACHIKIPAGIMKNAAMPLYARAILFGPASLQDKGSRRPQNQTLRQLWNVVEVNTALVAFVCTTVVFVLVMLPGPGLA